MDSVEKYKEQVKRAAKSIGNQIDSITKGSHYCVKCETFQDAPLNRGRDRQKPSCENCGKKRLVQTEHLELYRTNDDGEHLDADTLPPWLK